MGDRRSGWHLAVPIVFAIAGLIFVASATSAKGADLRDDTRRTTRDLLVSEQGRVETLARQTAVLRADVDRLTAKAAGVDERLALVGDQVERLAGPAGLRPVSGPGVTVVLNDAPTPPLDEPLPPGVTLDSYVVHQQDVQAVVNALWAGGAQAMMLMDQRVIATSAVRCVGPLLILQGRTYPPPYRISAVGDPSQLLAALDASVEVRNYRDYVGYIGLGYGVAAKDELTVPAFEGTLLMHYAQAIR